MTERRPPGEVAAGSARPAAARETAGAGPNQQAPPLDEALLASDGCSSPRRTVLVVAAVAAWFGAELAADVSPLVAAVPIVGLVVQRRRVRRHPGAGSGWSALAVVLVGAGAFLATTGQASRALAGLESTPSGEVTGVAELVEDPRSTSGGRARRAVARLDGRHVDLRAEGGAAGALSQLRAGQRARVWGRARPVVDHGEWELGRHLVARVDAEVVEPVGGSPPLARAANRVHGWIAVGSAHLPDDVAALLHGVVVGDDRDLSPGARDDMLAAGLSHLTAVSGQNVALVLVLARPALARLGLGGRLLATLSLLGFVAVTTRGEPSVLRATAMAALAAGASAVGRPLDGVRCLAAAVTVLLLVDPLLVHRLGFQLSVAATAGMVLGAGPIADRLPGPRLLADAVGVTAAAQVAVAPLLLLAGASVPLVSLPANVVVGPLVASAMAWGVVAGPLAGLVPVLAPVAHLPTTVMLRIVLWVASEAAAAPLGVLGPVHVGAVATGVLVWLRSSARWSSRTGAATVLVALALAVPPGPPRPGHHDIGAGATVHVVGPGVVVELDGRADPASVLAATRQLGVRHVDLVVLRTPSARAGRSVEAIARRFGPAPVLSPLPAEVDGARALERPLDVTIGGVMVRVVPERGRLVVEVPAREVARAPPWSAR